MRIFSSIIYKNFEIPQSIDLDTAVAYTVGREVAIRDNWQAAHKIRQFLDRFTFGIASKILPVVASREELESRLSTLKQKVLKIDRTVRFVQLRLARKAYQKQREVVDRARVHSSFTVPDGTVQKLFEVAKVWYANRAIDPLNGVKGQIIWKKATQLGEHLKKEGFYVFYHAHTYPITFHLELASKLTSMNRSRHFKAVIPLETQRRFRPPGVARLFENTSAYLKSWLGRAINFGLSMDNNHRESIISCDAIEDNREGYESCHFFFTANSSIVQTHSSTGKSGREFDSKFLNSYLKEPHFLHRAVELFAKARKRVASLPGYGMVRVIAIRNQTVEDRKTNYIWRSHPLGRLCTCTHSPGSKGHDEFVRTLKSHQNGRTNECRPDFLGVRHFPQYRILTANLDKDQKKQIYTMDCLTKEEREEYDALFESLFRPLQTMMRLERLNECKGYGGLLERLMAINTENMAHDFRLGLLNVLSGHHALLEHNMAKLERDLPQRTVQLLKSVQKPARRSFVSNITAQIRSYMAVFWLK